MTMAFVLKALIQSYYMWGLGLVMKTQRGAKAFSGV